MFDTANACFAITGDANADTMGTDGAKFEFYFSGVFERVPGIMGDDGHVFRIDLIEDPTNIVAQTYYPNEDMSNNPLSDVRNF